MSVLPQIDGREALAELSRFRTAFYGCLSARADAFFELTDALLCADSPTRTPVELSLLAEHQRGYGSLYGALNHGRFDTVALRDLLISLPLPRFDGWIVLTVDVSPWLRSDAACSPERLFCLVHGRNGRSSDHVVPGWPYSFVAVLTPDRTSWTQVLDAVRLGPTDDAAAITAGQLRAVVERLVAADQWQCGDQNVLIVMDAGYDVMRLAWVLRDLPVELVGRLRSDRVLRWPAPSLKEYAQCYPQGGRPPRHGKEFSLARPASWTEPSVVTVNDTARYGKAEARAWDRLHPKLQQRSAWIDHDSELPVIEGTLIRLNVDHLPGDRDAPPVWLWSSTAGATPDDVDFVWSCYLRRFDLEHTFRLFKQSLGWTRPRLRDPQAADRWTWLVIAAHTQLRLAAPLAVDRRKPWEKTTRPGGTLTPTRVRRGFRHIRPHLACPARAPKPSRPGPGRPSGTRNRHPATRYDVGKTLKRPATLTERDRRG
ncbi:transposase [Streptomyces sp. NBC_01381]|uniref:NF041680 family putative transposase n=2 Tax=unclassified Streptomyces TaxID=2593676 RepID=UPI002251CD0D|nr:NF041680 family putative transposase [Streptomyces sp. NBC_01381]MCX4673586.1 transposase [Streptomyces sp. NBC_01381]